VAKLGEDVRPDDGVDAVAADRNPEPGFKKVGMS
jgi:hypothetical protein